MYNKSNNDIGCLTLVLLILVILGIIITVNIILTKLIIWFSLGVFNYDLSDKFWYIFVGLTFILPMLKGTFSINIKNNK